MNNLRVLGIALDQGFRWRAHLDDSVARAMLRTRCLCAAVGTRNGVRADIFVSIYKTYVRPQLEYGSVV